MASARPGSAVGGGGGVGSSPLASFTKLRKLGEGGFGKVFLVRDARDGVTYVMKEIDLTKLDAKGRKEATKECAFLSRMSHPNIISYKEYFEVAAPPSQHAAGPWNAAAWKGAAPGARGAAAATLYIIMSYADGGDLESRIKAQQQLGQQQRRFCPFPEQQIIDWFLQTALALKHIHDRKVLHRDIKTQNIFLTKMNLVKLGDFGIAKDLATTMAKALTQIGTPFSLSPEICQEQPYDAKSDIWALGIVLYEMMCLTHPFNGSTMKQLITNIVRAKYTPPPAGVYSKPLCDLLGFLLQRSPKARPSINQLLRFPFIQQHIGRFLSSHKIQEEFSHTILHGGAAAAACRAAILAQQQQPQQQPQPQLQAKNAADAHAQAQQLAAQQQQEADRARDAQQRAAQAQQQAQAQAAAQQQKALAIQRAKMLAVQEAERARQAQAAMLRAQAEQAAAQRQKAEAAADARLRQHREAMQKEKEKQMARDAANRREAQRRADEWAKQDAREREQLREAKLERDRERAEAASAARDPAGLGPPPRRAQAAARASPVRPPWVGVIDEPAAAGGAAGPTDDVTIDGQHSHRGGQHDHNRESRDREQEQRDREREREKEQRDQEREWERQQRDQHERDREREHRHRQQQLLQQQQQQQQAAGRPPPQNHNRHSSERNAAPDSFAPTMVRPSPRDPRGELQFRQQQQQQLQSHQQQQQQQQQPRPLMQRASSGAELNSNRDSHNGGGGMESRSEKAAKQRAHEEQLALARKAYFEERKLLERRQKGLMDDGAGAAPGADPTRGAANRDDMPVGGGGGKGMNRASSEAVFDRPSSAAGLRKQQQQQRESVPSLEQAFPPRNAAAAAGGAGRKSVSSNPFPPASSPPPPSNAAPSAGRSDRPLSKAEAMAKKEEELARLRIEYFEERKQLQARKQKQLEEAGLVPVSSASPPTVPAAAEAVVAARPAPAVVAVVPAHPPAAETAPKASAKASRTEQLARDRALYFQQQRQKVAADSPEVTALYGHDPHLPSRPAAGSDSANSSAPPSPAAPIESDSGAEDDVVVGVQASRASVAHEAEASIDELASNTNSCQELQQLMATMREVMQPRDREAMIAAAAAASSKKASRAASPASADSSSEADASDDLPVEIDDEEDYQIPPATDPATETDDDEDADEDSAETELRGAVSDLSMSGQFSIDPAVLSDHASSEAGDEEDAEIEPATEAEETAQDEFEEHCADELRDAVAQALKPDAVERMEEEPADSDEQHSADDAADLDQHEPPSRASSGSSRAPTGQSGLYNASATLPPHRIPVITASGGAHYLAAPGPTVTSAHPPLHPVHSDSSDAAASAASSAVLSTTQSFPNGLLGAAAAPAPVAVAVPAPSFSSDPSSYKVESLRQFLSEKLGDDLLLEIYRLLRRNLAHQGADPPLTTLYSNDGAGSAQASPNVTMSAAQLAAGVGSLSARRGHMSSLLVGNVNIRELLYGSGLLSGQHQTKYISLIQQLIQAEHQLYGQL